MDSSIKTLTITGAAASSASEVKKSRRASRRKKVEDDEGLEMPVEPVKQIQIEKTYAALPSVPSVPLAAPKINTGSRVTLVAPQQKPVISPTQPVEKQEVKTATSVILNPPKVQRIKLQPKAHVQHVQKQVAGTRKARRISLSVSNLNHRFTRAKRVHDDTQKKPIDTIRSYLVERGVIQMKSRAPEKMLRSMYNDFNMLKDGQAL
jgi:peptide deformylase